MLAKLVDRIRGDYAIAYLALLAVALVVALVRWPIVAVDTDLWYHLNAGRYIASAHALPHGAFFSFVRPEPPWIDYYWLAQVLFYGVHSAAGYVGLVELRGLLAAGTFALILATLRLGKGSEGWGYSAVAFAAVALFVLPRFAPVRPHDLSYLAISAFVFVLESRRGLLALPLLAVLWVNFHGIEYPVMLLILGAYLGEWALARFGNLSSVTAPPVRAFVAVGVAMLCVLATPHGWALVAAPFTPLTFASEYIDELKHVNLSALFALNLDGLVMTRETLQTLVLVTGSLAAFASLRRARLRPAHWVLFLGGVFLLTRIQRFSAEFMLLAVPILGAFQPRLTLTPELPKPLRAALLVALAALSFRHLYEVVDGGCGFPMCTRRLPDGSVAFLRHVGASGTILNHPNEGGFLEWELYPRFKVFGDLQTPFLFSDTLTFVGDQAFQDGAVLASLVEQYHPSFLLVPKAIRGFGALAARFPDYAPVFIDDAAVLYASSTSQPQVVTQYRITAIDPATLQAAGTEKAVAMEHAAAEAARINAIYPGGGRMRVFEGALALERGDIDGALRIADDVTARLPDRWEAHRLRGDAFVRLQRAADAAQAYEAALSHMDADVGADQTYYLEGRLWSCYAKLGRREDAYRALRKAFGDLYRPAIGHEELASLASAALDAGHEAEGKTLLEFALAKTPASAPELRRQLEAKLRSLSATR